MQTAAVGSAVPDLYAVMLPTHISFPAGQVSWDPIDVVINCSLFLFIWHIYGYAVADYNRSQKTGESIR